MIEEDKLNALELFAENEYLHKEIERLNNDIKVLLKENSNKEKVIIAQNNIINKAIEYIKQQTTNENTGEELGYSDLIDYEYLLEILKGEDNE